MIIFIVTCNISIIDKYLFGANWSLLILLRLSNQMCLRIFTADTDFTSNNVIYLFSLLFPIFKNS